VVGGGRAPEAGGLIRAGPCDGIEEAMAQTLGSVTLLVRDYDRAIEFFTGALGFELLEDTALEGGKRWVLVRPRGSGGASLLLARASSPEEEARVGNQAGGRVFLFLHTDDFRRDYRAMKARGVRFREDPREEPYGTVAVFEDLCGNRWDLIAPAAPTRGSDSTTADPAPEGRGS